MATKIAIQLTDIDTMVTPDGDLEITHVKAIRSRRVVMVHYRRSTGLPGVTEIPAGESVEIR